MSHGRVRRLVAAVAVLAPLAVASRLAAAQSVEAPGAAAAPLTQSVLLEQQLDHYRRLAADATVVPARIVPTIHPGERLEAAPQLAAWLVALGDLAAGASVPRTYGGALVEAVQRFQARHGLAPDGVIGAATATALAVPAVVRARQIELTLVRLREQPPIEPGRAVLVNVPAFELAAFDDVESGREPVLRMSVVVGHAFRTETPFVNAVMRTVVFAPYWHVPRSIIRKEILPKLRADPDYLAAQDMEIVADGEALPTTPDGLTRLAQGRAELRQRPGPLNALGKVKFLFPNPFHVYMHDTPVRGLFRRARRDFSHGCIRLADAPALARWVLGGEGWDAARVDAMLEVMQSTSVPLRRSIPVVIGYATAVARADGTISFYDDVYGRDAALERAMPLEASPIVAPAT